MIISWQNKATESFWNTGKSRVIPAQLQQRVMDRLQALNAAASIDDLRVPPSNRLEKLSGDRKGFWSIRVNQQWRIVFSWANGNAYDVEFVDYH
ncbi:MAG: type II toxin-antitoxin system RelE/ParE family toxin [Alphaproteobacteria bacterium]